MGAVLMCNDGRRKMKITSTRNTHVGLGEAGEPIMSYHGAPKRKAHPSYPSDISDQVNDLKPPGSIIL